MQVVQHIKYFANSERVTLVGTIFENNMCNNFLQILKGLLSLARSVEITTDPDQEVVPACDLLRGNATCYVDIVITSPPVLIGLWHCVHIVILPLPLILIYCMDIGNLSAIFTFSGQRQHLMLFCAAVLLIE